MKSSKIFAENFEKNVHHLLLLAIIFQIHGTSSQRD